MADQRGWNPLDDVPQVDAAAAHDLWLKGEADFLDVREQHEWDLGHIDGIRFIPLGRLPYRWRELNPARKLICVCRSGNRSNYAAAALHQVGIDAANLSGGMLAWKKQGLPVTPPGIVEEH